MLKLQSWTKLLRQNRKSIFPRKTPLTRKTPPNQCCSERVNIDNGGSGG